MFQANCYNVMIVSPSDISEEREIAKNVLYRWNELNSRFHNIVFSVLGYDINAHADSGIHPQESLNHQLLEQADLIIAIFWTKLGTPTTEYSSGSVEEISKHIEQGKKALIYFSNKTVDPRNIDSEQYKNLQEYKKSIQGRAFYKEFSSEDEFRKILENDIQLFSNELIQNNTENKKKSNNTMQVTISDKEIEILKSMEDDGELQFIQFVDGPNLNGRTIDNPREAAEIKEAINKLESYNLIEDIGYKGELFRLTAEGYRACDEIHKQMD